MREVRVSERKNEERVKDEGDGKELRGEQSLEGAERELREWDD